MMITSALTRSALSRRYGRRYRVRLTVEVWNPDGERVVNSTFGHSPEAAPIVDIPCPSCREKKKQAEGVES